MKKLLKWGHGVGLLPPSFACKQHGFVPGPDGHPNSPTCGHLKFPHPERGVTAG